MNKQDADRMIESYVRKLYGFAMSRLGNISEAEELAGEIVLTVYKTLLTRSNIANADGYIYRIAHNVYVRYIDKKHRFTAVDGIEYIPDEHDITEDIEHSETVGILRREITYLSEMQRKIVVLHYFRDKKVREIAEELSLSPNTVKWYLFCSRKELSTNMEKTRVTGTLGVQPISFCSMGHSGHPGEKGDTASFLAKSLTQNIAYAAYHQPRTINEIAEELGVNPIFIRDEVDVLEEYGFMDKLPRDKYRTNIHITIASGESVRIYSEIDPKYTVLFAEKFFAPVLESMTEIPEWLTVPDNDIDLYKWCYVCFLAHKLATAEISDNKYSVKRPDGGDYVAHAHIKTALDSETSGAEPGIYGFCGDMWREGGSAGWRSWQFNCHWTDRDGGWTDNLFTDYDKLYYYLKGELPETDSNVESYQRLIDKGYLLKKDRAYKCNIILCESEKRWRGHIPAAAEEITALSREYAAKAAEAELYGQPEHMHEQIRYYNQNAACALHTRIMKQLLDMGVLKLPTAEQAKGLCTILFLGE